MALFKALAIAAFIAFLAVQKASAESQCETHTLQPEEDTFLDELEHQSFLFFWEQTNSSTGQVKDRALTHGQNDNRPISSIASTGYGLSAMTIAHKRSASWNLDRAVIHERVRTTLRFIWYDLPHVNGFFYHFVDMNTGERQWNCELSSIDTAILICGVLNVRQYFHDDAEITMLATNIYERVNYTWMLEDKKTLSMGWTPENGFLADRWNRYCELMMLVLQAIGSPTHPIPVSSWEAFTREPLTYDGLTYIQTSAPLFIHQFSHAWYDFRNKRDRYTDYFENSCVATEVHKRWSISLKDEFPSYSEEFWGLTASDTSYGYDAWGGPPRQGKIDGSIVPCAAAGSLVFQPTSTLKVLMSLRKNYPKSWDRYGFIDAFNPVMDWWNPDVIGIDLGITILMAENLRTGHIWEYYMRDPSVRRSMEAVGLY